jgi:hypothetical protein
MDGMPKMARVAPARFVYHVLNRSVGRMHRVWQTTSLRPPVHAGDRRRAFRSPIQPTSHNVRVTCSTALNPANGVWVSRNPRTQPIGWSDALGLADIQRSAASACRRPETCVLIAHPANESQLLRDVVQPRLIPLTAYGCLGNPMNRHDIMIAKRTSELSYASSAVRA